MSAKRNPMLGKHYLEGIAQSFRAELARLHDKMAWPSYKTSTIELKVEYSTDECKWFVSCCAGDRYGNVVKGSDLGVVMDEIYRRLGYEDRKTARIDSSMKALPPPDDDDPQDSI
jgi:hypothetical protein